MSGQTVILFSTLNTEQTFNLRRMENLFLGHKIDVTKIDGSDMSNKDMRDKLFGVSGQRGKYPQCFIQRGEDYTFVGLWEKVEQLGECESLPKEVLDANPTIETVSKVFVDVKKTE